MPNNWYVDYGDGSTTGYYAVPMWTALTAYVSTSNGGRGDYVRQRTTPAVNSERVFRCTVSGTSLASQPAFVLTRNGSTPEAGGPTWVECTGQEADQGPGGGVAWKAPFARVSPCVGFAGTWGVAGDTIFIGDDHAETQTTSLSMIAGDSSNFMYFICADHTKVPPGAGDLMTTATIACTNAAATLTLSSGWAYVRGLKFQANGSVNLSTNHLVMEKCEIKTVQTTATTLGIGSGSGGGIVEFYDVKYSFAGILNTIGVKSSLIWKNSNGFGNPFAGGSAVPSILFAWTASADVVIEGVDLSAITGTLVNSSATYDPKIFFKDCKVASGVVWSVAPILPGGPEVYSVRCDNGATNYQFGAQKYSGYEDSEVTITRVGGAVTPNSQSFSKKIVTRAVAKWVRPYDSLPLSVYNNLVGSSRTLTVYGTINAGAVPTNADIWLEVEYLSDAANPIGSFVSNAKANIFTAGTALTADAVSTWNGGGSGGGWSPFSMSVSFTPQMAGPVTARLRVAKASTTYYIDAKPVIT